MRLLLIVNPTASSMTPRRRVQIEHVLSDRHRLEVAETFRRGHATRLARAAAREGMDAVVVLAGDGTLNEAADGLAGSDTALAPLPGGSTNVFARTIGYENDLHKATDQLIVGLNRRSYRRIGTGIGNDRRFLFHLGAGFDARVIQQVERHAWLKRSLAHPTFAVAAITTFLRGFDHTRPPFRVQVGDEPAGDGYFAIVSNTAPYAFFGPRPLMVTKAAGLDRPLALTMYRRLELGSLLQGAGSAMATGRRIQKLKDVEQRADLTQLTLLTNHGPFPWQVDGDYLGEIERIDVRYDPDSLTIVVPPAS